MALRLKAVTAWLKMTAPNGTSRMLDGVAGLRIRLSTALGIAPVNTQRYGNPIHYGICFGAGDTFDKYDGWRRRLSIAETGTETLRAVDDLTEQQTTKSLASGIGLRFSVKYRLSRRSVRAR